MDLPGTSGGRVGIVVTTVRLHLPGQDLAQRPGDARDRENKCANVGVSETLLGFPVRNAPRKGEFLQHQQSLEEDQPLADDIARATQHLSQAVSVGVQRTRRPHQSGFFRHHRNKDGRDPSSFDLSLHRNDYPVADRSTAGQQDGVRLGTLDLRGDGRSYLFVHLF